MFGKKRTELSTLFSSSPEEESTAPDDNEISTTDGYHCAWCGDPPDQYGSHGICPEHAAQEYARYQASRQLRREVQA